MTKFNKGLVLTVAGIMTVGGMTAFAQQTGAEYKNVSVEESITPSQEVEMGTEYYISPDEERYVPHLENYAVSLDYVTEDPFILEWLSLGEGVIPSVYALELSLKERGLEPMMVEIQDMRHIFEVLRSGLLVAVDMDITFLPESTREYMEPFKMDGDYIGNVHTVNIIGTSYVNDEIQFHVYDPFYKVSFTFTQTELRNATIGAGLHDMVMIDVAPIK